MLGLWLAGLVVIIMALPVADASRGQLLSLFGILLSAAIALSSATLIGNMVAGAMLRAVRAFRAGDFIQAGQHFGRVSERGLYHVEIQTEDRDLTTLPNLYLASHPVTVVNSKGTIVSASLSLGYDVPRSGVERLLVEAAQQAGLQEPFVQILDLGDSSVTYRIAGLLSEVRRVLSVRSDLRARILDVLHGAGIEIVSPSFMNTRAFPEEMQFIPSTGPRHLGMETGGKTPPESLVFDKADHAELLEKLGERKRLLEEEIEQLEKRLRETKEASEREALQAQVERLGLQKERLTTYLKNEAQAEGR
jgi:small-conductance mechanosensitive channel